MRWCNVGWFLLALAASAPLAADDAPMPWEEFWKLDNRLGGRRLYMESFALRGRRQLFIDNYIIEHVDNLKKVLHQPRRSGNLPVLSADKPWEGSILWINVIKDEEENLFKVWYQTAAGLGYATSNDGLAWNKPILNLVDANGSKANNLVMSNPGMDSPTVVKDPFDKDPQRRYKYFAKHNLPKYGMYAATSPDGIHWSLRPERVITSAQDPGLNDRPNLMLDLAQHRYIALLKTERINPYGSGDWGMIHRMRTSAYSTDFEHWTNPGVILKADDQDPPSLQIYGMSAFNYEGMYLAVLDMFHSYDSGPTALTIDCQLALSRNGEDWWRAGNRKTFFPYGAEGNWDRFRVYPSNTPPIRNENELWFYYRGTGASRHGPPPPEYRSGAPWFASVTPADEPLPEGVPGTGMGLARLRRDGFVSMDAGPRPGSLYTKPLIFDGSTLHVNADARTGYVRAELYVAEKKQNKYGAYTWTIGAPVQGFTFADSVPVRSDTIDGVLRWRENESLAGFAGKNVVIRFQLSQASLYSFWLQ